MANMGTVAVSYQQFRIKRNRQETKKPAHLGKKIAGAAGLNLFCPFSPLRETVDSSVGPHITKDGVPKMGEAVTDLSKYPCSKVLTVCQ
jgi:hypothetical protein